VEIVVILFILVIQIGIAYRGRCIGRRGIRATTEGAEAEKGAVVVVVVLAVHDRAAGVGIIGIHHRAAALGLQTVVEIEEIASHLLGSGWMWILL